MLTDCHLSDLNDSHNGFSKMIALSIAYMIIIIIMIITIIIIITINIVKGWLVAR